MMLIRYQGVLVGFMGATQYGLTPELTAHRPDDVDLQRVRAVCEWALEVRRLTGREPGRLPGDRPPSGGGRRD